MSSSADPRSLTAMVFMVAFAVTSMWLTMQSLGHSAELTKLSSAIDSHRASMREQLDLASAARRSLEESISGAQESDRKAHNALQKTVHDHKEKDEAANAAQAEAASTALETAKEEMHIANSKLEEALEAISKRVTAVEGKLSEALSGLSFVQELGQKVDQAVDTLSAQRSTVSELELRSNETAELLQGLVSHVVQIRGEFSNHSTTLHKLIAQPAAAAAAAVAASRPATTHPPAVLVAPPSSPPRPVHANGRAAEAAEASKIDEAVAASMAATTSASASRAAAAGAAEVTPEGNHLSYLTLPPHTAPHRPASTAE